MNSRRDRRRAEIVKAIKDSGVEISKTGAAYRDPESIIKSDKAQSDLKRISEIKRRI